MDQFAATMIARGPTFTSDGTLTGSVHVLDLPDPAAARAFAFEEPGYQAGAYRDVLLRRWHNSLGQTMWDFSGGRPSNCQDLWIGVLRGLLSARWVGRSFDEFALVERGAGADERDEVRCVHRAPALLCGLDQLERHRDTGGA